ncbi:MAG: multicopper oxidase domain-containing protein [Nitrospirae bacterium]|nr:multicopper oxidase domain-containing protein [Nitrospirota bacterium]
MDRRDFLKCSAVGIAALSMKSLIGCSSRSSSYRGLDATLNFSEALVGMVDTQPVYMWLFEDPLTGPRFPGPVLVAEEGETVYLTLTNLLNEDHAFAIPGVVDSGVIRPGKTKVVSFVAPAAGTYLYFDPLNAPVNRVLGLHGVMEVIPETSTGTPYTSPTAKVASLFADLGTTDEFPGQPWDPARILIWVLHSIDPSWNAMAEEGRAIDPAAFSNNFLPRYFTINGRSGFFSSHDKDTAPSGLVGQPELIRIVNSGMATHSPHLHANHFYVLSVNNVVQDNVLSLDTFTVSPLDRVDLLIPFQRPPDIPAVHPDNPRQLLRLDAAEELTLSFGDVPQSPLNYPMHCHMEMSQTAAGGNYPLGLVTHLTFTGDVDGELFQ